MVEVSVFFKLLFHTFSLFMYSVCVCVCVHVRTRVHAQLLSYVQLFGPNYSNPMDYSAAGSSVHGIFQARILECAISYSRGYS